MTAPPKNECDRIVNEYFDQPGAPTLVNDIYTPGRGWQATEFAGKPVTQSMAIELARRGVTVIEVKCEGRYADFRVSELTQTWPKR